MQCLIQIICLIGQKFWFSILYHFKLKLSYLSSKILPITARQYGEVVLPDAIPAKVGSLNWAVICHWPEKEGMARVFAIQVQVLLSITRVAVQVRSEPVNYHGTECLLGELAQCRGTSYLEARNLSRCRLLIWCRCACPGAYTITKLSWEQEQKQKP